MTHTVNYFFAPSSPWTYLGHNRFAELLSTTKANVRLFPVDLGKKIFPATGGLPVGARSAQRQAYRKLELGRFSALLKIPLNLEPSYFPVDSDSAAKLIIAVQRLNGEASAMRLTGEILTSVWSKNLNIADKSVLLRVLEVCELSNELWEASLAPWVQNEYDENTKTAIVEGVFGAPSYVLCGEIFWGQDRLDFLKLRLLERFNS